MFENYVCGVNTDHKRGYIYRAYPVKDYLLMRFKTPFFYEIDGKRFEGKSGDCILHKPNSYIAHGPLSEHTSFVNDWIHFTYSEEDAAFLQILPTDKLIPMNDGKIFERLLTEITEESLLKDEYSKRIVSDNVYRMLVLLLRADEEKDENPLCLQFKEIRTYVMNHISEKWTLESMAKLSGYSVSRFCALYTEFFDTSPLNDLLEARLKTAKRLLALQSYKIGDVAQMCGFTSIHYFSKFFKNHTGKSPNEYYK